MKKRKRMSAPSDVIKAVEGLGLKKTNKDHAYKFLSLLLRKGYEEESFAGYIPMPAEYLMKVFNKDYHNNFFNRLKRTGIIQCIESYQAGNDQSPGRCKRYRINPELLKGNVTTVEYLDRKAMDDDGGFFPINQTYWHPNSRLIPSVPNVYRPVKCVISNNETLSPLYPLHICSRFFRKQLVIDDLASLHYNVERLNHAISEEVKSIGRNDILVNDEIEDNWIKEGLDHFSKRKFEKRPKNTAIAMAREKGGALIQRKRDFYIDDVDNFIEWRKGEVARAARLAVKDLEVGNFFVSRSTDSNYRLNHNLTMLNSFILDIIATDNDLIELDLKNSQFAIHAHWLKEEGLMKHADVKQYFDICITGTLYETIAEIIGKDRKGAKGTMLYVAFSKVGSTGKNKKAIRERFPNVIAHMDKFKKSLGDHKEFSIELQKREAVMFVDNLYANIKQQGLFCLTKHDSLLIKKDDLGAVKSIIEGYFNHIGFEGTLSDVN